MSTDNEFPCSDVLHRIIPDFNSVPSGVVKITGIQNSLSALSLVYRDFSRFSFDNIVDDDVFKVFTVLSLISCR